MLKKYTYEELQQRVAELEERSDNAEEVSKSFFDQSHSIMLLIHPESGHILDANITACDFYGYSKQDITKMRIMDINTLSEEQVLKEMQKAKLAKREVFNFSHRLASGEVKDVEVFSGPIRFHGKQVLYSIIHDISARKSYEQERERLITDLEEALAEIKTLRGILPICATCKKIRDDKGYWNKIETYFSTHSDVEFTHGICPECHGKFYSDLKRSPEDRKINETEDPA